MYCKEYNSSVFRCNIVNNVKLVPSSVSKTVNTLMQEQVDQFPNGQDAGSNKQPHGTADVTCNIDSA